MCFFVLSLSLCGTAVASVMKTNSSYVSTLAIKLIVMKEQTPTSWMASGGVSFSKSLFLGERLLYVWIAADVHRFSCQCPKERDVFALITGCSVHVNAVVSVWIFSVWMWGTEICEQTEMKLWRGAVTGLNHSCCGFLSSTGDAKMFQRLNLINFEHLSEAGANFTVFLIVYQGSFNLMKK